MDDLIKRLRSIAKVRYGATVGEAREVSKTLTDAADLITRLLSLVSAEEAQGRMIAGQRNEANRRAEALLQQARIWALEARTHQSVVDEVGVILGGIPNWGPIAAGVEALKADARRYDTFCEAGWPICWCGVDYWDRESLDAALDKAREES